MVRYENYLQVVQNCDKVPYEPMNPKEGLPFLLEDGTVVGTLLAPVVLALTVYNNTLDPAPFIISAEKVQFNTYLQTVEDRTLAVDTLMKKWRQEETFAGLAGWRNELYAVYGRGGAPAFVMERAATPLFGISTFGVHVNVYTQCQDQIKLWIARRSLSKPTWPGSLDNAVAGGIPYTYATKETVVKECDEEASIPESIARNAKNVGVISYYTESVHGLQPETEYLFDLQLPSDYQLKPKDGEVECFYLWTLDEVKESLLRGDWKPNCALVTIEFMMRHGYITADNEPDYIEISYHLHRRLEFPCPKKPLEIKQHA